MEGANATVGCFYSLSFGINCFRVHWGTLINIVKNLVFFPAFYILVCKVLQLILIIRAFTECCLR